MTEFPYRTHPELIGLLAEVDDVLSRETPAGIMYVLYVIGGAAVGAVFETRLTQDVDIATDSIPPQVLKAASIVAKRHNMPDGWINNQAAEFIEADLPVSSFHTMYEGACLLVRAAKPETLLAMKLMSGRGKDVRDILDLAEHTGIVSYESLMGLCDRVYAATPSYRIERQWVSSVIGDIQSLLKHKRSGMDIKERTSGLVTQCDGTAI